MDPYHNQPYQQPPPQGQQQQQVVIIGQPQSAPTNGQPQNIRDWSTGICGCFEDCNSCMLGFLCPPIHWCCLASKMDECALGPCCCGNAFVIAMRTKTRSMYGIRGSILQDCCCVACCACCAATQMDRELKNSGHIH